MAEISSSNRSMHSKGRGVTKRKKLSTRVDLTPMVDLGFLLITFFIFTTTMSEPTAMRVYLPDDTGEPTPVARSGVLTLLLGKNDTVYYYEGELEANTTKMLVTTFKGVRDLIINKKKSVEPGKFVVIIKPQQESLYKNTVDALDEMTINDVRRFSLGEVNRLEEAMMTYQN